MDFDFWDNCWHRDSQPFHVTSEHPLLAKHLDRFDPDEKLLLPLSGKSVDPIFLAQHQIYSTAVEFNPKAVEAFIKENKLAPKKSETDNGVQFQLANFEVWLADFFALTSEEIGLFSQVFDRAALVALPEDLRQRYAKHLASMLKPQAKIFMVTMDYDPEQMDGPPFHINQSQLQTYFPSAEIVEIDRHSLINNHPRWKELELSFLDEVLYQINL
ncbi:MAG: thiopurine S-methyltransferase [Gammaproteobacteria bacterium]|nr:thiopurine S-methyltransferase [Gammaproteobacteria bacterium]